MDFDEILHSEIDEKNPAPFAYYDWSRHSYFKFRTERIAARPELSVPHGDNVYALFNDYIDYLSAEAGESPFFLMDVKYKSLHHFDPVWQPLSAPKFIFDLIKRRGCRVLHLVRQNVFDVYLSGQVVKWTGKYVKTENDVFEAPRLVIDVESMLREIQLIETEVNLVRFDLESLPRVCEITYESISSTGAAMPDSVAGELSRFFGRSLEFKETPHIKKIVQDRWSIVENAEEVQRALKASVYSWCI